ncbi:hypothetical protein ID858_14055 [Xenorhabdus sp. DI]|uniref:hypothetical protein n=1 Tax=Xenorhabdus doucetiae TaxID=351671 RepID=UPI0019B2A79D|nr:MULTISPECIES: hypothetical protein [unclassified Xenorhabdus]MBD2784162.1 hypothetical protein [Xenorhabdus sp. 3]MBD2789628.1 hypothetical protein [Xenorhabdus sp. DI]
MNNKLQTAVEIAEEIEASISPVVNATQNESEPDTHLMCRGIYRQMKGLAEKLREVSGGNNESLCNKLEVSASKIEGLKTYIALLLDNENEKQSAHLLSIALDQAIGIGEEIARVRGIR